MPRCARRAGEGEARRQPVQRGGRGRRGRAVAECRHRRDDAAGDRRVGRGEDRAPRSVRHGRQAGRDRAVEVADSADAEADRARERGLLVEGVELAVVDGVRLRCDDLAGEDVDEPDVVARRALHDTPAGHAGIGRELLRQVAPADVEPVGSAPAGDAGGGDRADAGIERVGVAGQPGKRDRDRDGGCLRLLVRPDDPGFRERLVLRELELVAHRTADGQPGERRCARELALGRLVGAEQERLQALRRGRSRGDARLHRSGDRERDKAEKDETSETHRLPSSAGRRPRPSLKGVIATLRQRGRARRRPRGPRSGATPGDRPPQCRTAAPAPASRARRRDR